MDNSRMYELLERALVEEPEYVGLSKEGLELFKYGQEIVYFIDVDEFPYLYSGIENSIGH